MTNRNCEHLDAIHEATCGECDCGHPNRFADVFSASQLTAEHEYTFEPNNAARVVVVKKSGLEIMNLPFDLISRLASEIDQSH